MSFQLCLRCGRHEFSGAFCSFCRTAEYDLVDHEHARDDGSGCPFGARLDPLQADVSAIRRFLEKPPTARLVGIPVRHHPRAHGYDPSSDPKVPSWVPRPGRAQPRAGARGADSHAYVSGASEPGSTDVEAHAVHGGQLALLPS